MKLSREAIEELRGIYRRKFGKELSPEEASEIGGRLVRFLDVLIRIPPSRTPGEKVRTPSHLTDPPGNS